MMDWRKESSALIRKMEDTLSGQRPIPRYQKAILALLILAFIGALVRLFVWK